MNKNYWWILALLLAVVVGFLIFSNGNGVAYSPNIAGNNSSTGAHLACVNQMCVTVKGNGTNECRTNADCLKLPDLIVSSIVVRNNSGTGNSTVNITAVISNIGNANAGNSSAKFILAPFGGYKIANTPAIPMGQNRSVNAVFVVPRGFTYNVTVIADFLNGVAESNEGNNQGFKTFFI